VKEIIYNDIFCPFCSTFSNVKQIPKKELNANGQFVFNGYEPNWFFCLNDGYHIYCKEETKLVA